MYVYFYWSPQIIKTIVTNTPSISLAAAWLYDSCELGMCAVSIVSYYDWTHKWKGMWTWSRGMQPQARHKSGMGPRINTLIGISKLTNFWTEQNEWIVCPGQTNIFHTIDPQLAHRVSLSLLHNTDDFALIPNKIALLNLRSNKSIWYIGDNSLNQKMCLRSTNFLQTHTFIDPCWGYSWEQLYESVVLCRGLLAGAGCLCFAQCLRKLKITTQKLWLSCVQLALSQSQTSGQPQTIRPAPNLLTPWLSRDQEKQNHHKNTSPSFFSDTNSILSIKHIESFCVRKALVLVVWD